MLTLVIFFPLVAACIAAVAGRLSGRVALGLSLVELLLSLLLLPRFQPAAGTQFFQNLPWIPSLGINYIVGADGISLLLILLTTVLVPLIILSSLKNEYSSPGLFYSLILFMQFALLGVFASLDGFLFYIFWELALIPIYLICLMWGGKERFRITLKFFIYTLSGSLVMLVAFIWLWLQTPAPHSFSLDAFYALELTATQQGWIFWAFFLAFAIKMPVFPFHTWQPDTYVDSPTPGTMLLSGIMLKMGIYGVIRWMLPIVPDGIAQWGLTAMILSIIGVIYASLIAIVQKDFKRLIAYSSIAHVGLIAAGIFSLNFQGLQGGVIQMISHGINVVGLFFIADIIQRRADTRMMDDLGGIRNHAPQFATAFMIVMLASVALPLTNGFVGEFLLLNGIFAYDALAAALAGLSVILGAVYMLRSYQKIALGESNRTTMQFADLTMQEKLVLVPVVVLIFWIGLFPNTILDIAGPSVEALQRNIVPLQDLSSVK